MDKDRINALRDMLGSKGWKYFNEEAEERLISLREGAIHAKNTEELFYLKGFYDALHNVVNYESLVDLYEGISNESPL